MNKYPVTYKGQEYEIRWEKDYYRSHYTMCINIYEVIKGKNLFRKEIIIMYEKIDSYSKEDIDKEIACSPSDIDLYIKEAKCALNKTIKKIEKEQQKELLEQQRKQALKNWDGNMED